MKEEEKGLGRVWEAVNQSFEGPVSDGMDRGKKEIEAVEKNHEREASSNTDQVVINEKEESDTIKDSKGLTPRGVHVDLTSGYFGLYDAYKRMIIESPAPVRVIAASPKVSP